MGVIPIQPLAPLAADTGPWADRAKMLEYQRRMDADERAEQARTIERLRSELADRAFDRLMF
jgi:hypothetical protein